MKEVVAHAYANTKEQISEIITVLEKAGYEIAYEAQTNVSIIKEVADDIE